MGLRRCGDRVYFAYSWRVGPIVFNNVAATGELARAMAEMIDRKRAARRAEREQAERDEAAIIEYCYRVEVIARAALLATGNHNHRGEWRRLRNMAKVKAGVPAKRKKALPPWTPGDRSDGWLDRAVEHAEAGDRAALADLRGFLATLGPADVEPRGIAGAVEEALIGQGGGDVLTREWFRLEIARLRDELAGPDPAPLERLLAERVAFSWFEACQADRHLAALEGAPLAQAKYAQLRATSAHKRLLMAVRTLATVRAKALPVLRRASRFDGMDLILMRPSGAVNGHPRACLESDG